MKPTNEWMKIWKEKRDVLSCPNDLNEYFELDEIAGQKLARLSFGKVSVPSGEILVRDPLVYLNKDEEPYFEKVPTGEFETEGAVILSEEDCARYAAVRVKFNDNKVVRFGEALLGHEDIKDLEEGEYFGFNVDAGLGTILDKETLLAFDEFFMNWHKEKPEGNIYDDYFADIFKKNYEKNPNYQRDGGDWINWCVPGTNLHMPIFQSGFGDGTYPVYFGYDENDSICCLVIEFIDIKMTYEDEEQ